MMISRFRWELVAGKLEVSNHFRMPIILPACLRWIVNLAGPMKLLKTGLLRNVYAFSRRLFIFGSSPKRVGKNEQFRSPATYKLELSDGDTLRLVTHRPGAG